MINYDLICDICGKIMISNKRQPIRKGQLEHTKLYPTHKTEIVHDEFEPWLNDKIKKIEI